MTHSLPQAVRERLDAFHVVRLGQACVDDVRRRVQQQTLGRRGHRDDPLYRARRDLRRGLDTTDRQWARLELALVVGDPSGRPTDTWMAAQELQFLYARSHDMADAKRRLWRILDRCARSQVPDCTRLARTLDSWRDELLAYWTATGRRGVSTVSTEATTTIKKTMRRTRLPETDNYIASGCSSPSVWTGHTVHWQAPPAHPDPRPLTTSVA